MNRKTIVSLAVIAVLGVIVAVHNMKSSKSLPGLSDISGRADEISLKGADYSMDIRKGKTGWSINKQGYSADANSVEQMEKKVSGINIVDLISKKGYYNKYELDEKNAFSVVLSREGRVLRKVLIGKAGTTKNHVYVRIDDRPEVYLASGLFREDFKRSVDELRDKKIFSVKKEALETFSIRYKGKTYSFFPSIEEKKDSDKAKESVKPVSGNTRTWYCRELKGAVLNNSVMNNLVSSFDPLRADTFPEGMTKRKAGKPVASVRLRAYDKNIEFNIYGSAGKAGYYAASSESEYGFTVGSWLAERFFIKSRKDIVK